MVPGIEVAGADFNSGNSSSIAEIRATGFIGHIQRAGFDSKLHCRILPLY